MLLLLHHFIQVIQPILVPLCFVLTWTFLMLLSWTLWSAIRDATGRAKQMHQIPCPNCQFFTDDCRLKCTVHPKIASTENAIECPDYRPRKSLYY